MDSRARGQSPVLVKPWLRPSVASLLALTDDVPNREAILADPGLVLHVLRYSRPTPLPDSFSFNNRIFTQPTLCQTAAALWERDHVEPEADPAAMRVGLEAAQIASGIATQSKLCSPDAAYAAALLTPLGWYLGDTSPGIARRMLTRWRMPDWFTATVGYLELNADDCVKLGAPRGLLGVVRTAIRAAEARLGSIGLLNTSEPTDPALKILPSGGCYPPEMLLKTQGVDAVRSDEPLLPRLLRLAAASRSRSGAAWLVAAEERIEELVQSLAEARSEFDTTLRDAKLASLAEFAAGASHEINNPLAVIAGNVHLLKNLDPDPEYQAQLATILRQTKRIHDILHGTRQFARPSLPQRVRVRVETLFDGVRKELEPEAEARRVQLEFSPTSASVYGDPGQLRTALGHLVRNALEATPPCGAASVTAIDVGGSVEIAIEDSGPGPATDALPHLFDPFFSGREAGRGRGLGLPIAWRYFQANDGDVRFAPTSGSPSRFVVTIPVAPIELQFRPSGRKSA